MLRPILLFLLMMPACLAVAEETDELDSLWRAFREPRATAHDRLITLNEIAYDLRSANLDSSLTVSKQLLSLAQRDRDTLMIALGYRDIGLAYLMMRSNGPVLAYLDTARTYYGMRNDSAYLSGAGGVESNLAFAYKNTGQLELAMDHYRRSLGGSNYSL